MAEAEMLRFKPEHPAPPAQALAVEIRGMTKRFGAFTALDGVSLRVAAGSFHALLGENGAGKSTLVKCLVGFYRPDSGQIQIDEHEAKIRAPHDAHALGIGMVYQHFTLVPSMTAAENLVMSRADVPAIIRWRRERERLAAFMQTVPFKVPLDKPVSRLAAVDRISLSVCPGEIVGIAGVSGNGQRELVQALVGQRRPVSGKILIEGKPYFATRGEI